MISFLSCNIYLTVTTAFRLSFLSPLTTSTGSYSSKKTHLGDFHSLFPFGGCIHLATHFKLLPLLLLCYPLTLLSSCSCKLLSFPNVHLFPDMELALPLKCTSYKQVRTQDNKNISCTRIFCLSSLYLLLLKY